MNDRVRPRGRDDDAATVVDIQGHEVVEPKDWRLKAVNPATIKNARRAAQINGLRLGAWVARVINEAATRELVDQVGAVASKTEPQGLQELHERLASLEVKVEATLDKMNKDSRVIGEQFENVQKDIKTSTFSVLSALQESQRFDRAI